MEQGSPEWFAARAGKITASRVKPLLAKTRSGWSTSRKNMITQLAIERLTGEIEDTYTNAAMQRGIDMEPEARTAYVFETGQLVTEEGICVHPDMPFATCSPDGLVGDAGLVEIKCPSAMAKHFEALQSGSHAKEYHWQLHHQIFVTGREWVDAVSYDPRFPDGLRLAIKRVHRDAEVIEELKAEILTVEQEITKVVDTLRAMQNERIAA